LRQIRHIREVRARATLVNGRTSQEDHWIEALSLPKSRLLSHPAEKVVGGPATSREMTLFLAFRSAEVLLTGRGRQSLTHLAFRQCSQVMYQQFYGLRELPFELTPNPKYLFLTPQHREALSTLVYGLSSGKGVTALIGEAGTGKTTLLHSALQSEHCRHVSCVYLMNPTLTRSEFIEILSNQFKLSAHASRSKAGLLHELDSVLRERRARGQHTALMIDEAQSLPSELLEEVRLLANTETAQEKLLSLVLAGQPELRDRLNETELRQLKQRVTLRCELTPFSLQETAAYIASRIRTAGGEAAKLFTREAVMLIHERSGGIARTVSVICDNALLTGFGMGRQPVDYGMVLEVARDFDLHATVYADPKELDAPLESSAPIAELVQQPSEVVSLSGEKLTPELSEISDDEDQQEAGEPQLFRASRPRPRFSFFGGR
jgi:general secretion pathway protein A